MTTTNVVVLDYGAGNLKSVVNALWRAGAEPILTSDPDVVRRAERAVLPGVGAAGFALERLRALHLDAALDDVRRAARPILGICLGMQLFAEEISEFGEHRGLGWLRGRVRGIGAEKRNVRVPHMGWSQITTAGRGSPMFGVSERDRYFYFCHSNCLEAEADVTVASVDYGRPLTCAIESGSVFACQFHPEKSDLAGLRLLKRFLSWQP